MAINFPLRGFHDVGALEALPRGKVIGAERSISSESVNDVLDTLVCTNFLDESVFPRLAIEDCVFDSLEEGTCAYEVFITDIRYASEVFCFGVRFVLPKQPNDIFGKIVVIPQRFFHLSERLLPCLGVSAGGDVRFERDVGGRFKRIESGYPLGGGTLEAFKSSS